MNIIRIESVSKVYGDNGVPVHAVKTLNLSVMKEEFMVIAGPSGSGKTTLLNLIGGLDKPTSGKVFFENKELGLMSRKELSRLRLNNIGFIFQAYNLIPVLTALENVEFVMMLQGIPEKERRKRSLDCMEDLGVRPLAAKKPNEMSGGEQQRVAVARAIVTNPSLVLADEPTANLDSKTGRNLLDLMERMNRERKITFIFSSHDPDVIERGRRLVIIHDGEITDEKISDEERKRLEKMAR